MNSEKKKALLTLKTARGQVEAAIKMLEDERYCIDISNQIVAAQALLKKANMIILKQHMENCVLEAFEKGNGNEKMDEIMAILTKLTDK